MSCYYEGLNLRTRTAFSITEERRNQIVEELQNDISKVGPEVVRRAFESRDRKNYWIEQAKLIRQERKTARDSGIPLGICRIADIYPETARHPLTGEVINNLKRMSNGGAPIGPDGRFANLHHKQRVADGGNNQNQNLVPILALIHQKWSRILHSSGAV